VVRLSTPALVPDDDYDHMHDGQGKDGRRVRGALYQRTADTVRRGRRGMSSDETAAKPGDAARPSIGSRSSRGRWAGGPASGGSGLPSGLSSPLSPKAPPRPKSWTIIRTWNRWISAGIWLTPPGLRARRSSRREPREMRFVGHLGLLFNLLDTPGHHDLGEDTYRTPTEVDSVVWSRTPLTHRGAIQKPLRGLPAARLVDDHLCHQARPPGLRPVRPTLSARSSRPSRST
jgi:hypothetical protein